MGKPFFFVHINQLQTKPNKTKWQQKIKFRKQMASTNSVGFSASDSAQATWRRILFSRQ